MPDRGLQQEAQHLRVVKLHPARTLDQRLDHEPGKLVRVLIEEARKMGSCFLIGWQVNDHVLGQQ